MSEYGTATVKRLDDGTTVVVQADDTIGVSAELLTNIDPHHIRNGLLVLDTAGEYKYWPSYFDGHGVIVCHRRCACNDRATHLHVGYPSGHHPGCEHQPDAEVRELWNSGTLWRRDNAD